MTGNKKTIERFMDGFNKSDHEQILSCLTDVIAEGTVLTKLKVGPIKPMVFCDVFEMNGGRISKLISFIANIWVG